MKVTKTMLGVAVAGALAFAASNSSAFPMKLTSVSGTLTVTSNYNALVGATSAKATTVSFNLKRVMTIITNQVFLNTGTNPPAGSYVAVDPYSLKTYLTNSAGYYKSLSGIVYVTVNDIATVFKGNANGGTEKDVVNAEIDIYGHGPDGFFYEAEIIGQGTISINANRNTSTATCSISGVGYGEFEGSDDGVAKGSFTLSGSGTPEWSGPYSVYWYNHLY